MGCYRGRSRWSAGRFGPGRDGFDRREGGGDGIRGPIAAMGPRDAPVRAMSEVISPAEDMPRVSALRLRQRCAK